MAKYFFTFLFIGSGILYAQSDGPFKGSGSDNNTDIGSESWSNLSNTYASNNSYATASLDPGEISNFIIVKGFNFDIDADDNITGIEINLEKSKSAGSIQDYIVKLVVGGVIQGDDKSTSDAWSGTDEMVTYGGATDKWGLTLTGADVNSAEFGIAISAQNTAGGGPSRTAQIDVSDITVSYSSALPIELLYFHAEIKADQSVGLEWTTATETNNDYFTIERSGNGLTFIPLKEVPGAGTSTEVIDYSMVDENPLSGVSYYRLKQTDLDGQFDYSDIIAISIERNSDGECIFKVMPNPCMTNCHISLTACPDNQNTIIQVMIIDAEGNLIEEHIPARASNGSFAYYINPENNLAPGLYIVRAGSNKESYNTKLITK